MNDLSPQKPAIVRFLRARGRSFGYAFAGWLAVIRTQPNSWIHLAASLAVILMAAWLRLDRNDWAALVIVMTMVWVAEFFNTAIEALVDLVSPEFHPLAGKAKDVAAGGVLVTAIGAAVVGLLILGPPLLARLGG